MTTCAARARLELHLRRGFDGLLLRFVQLEIVERLEAEALRDQETGKALPRGVVFGDGIVEEAPRRGNLVFDVRQLALQLLEILVRLQIRIGFRQRDQPRKRAGQRALGRPSAPGLARSPRRCAP